jgi:hypothetical protein
MDKKTDPDFAGEDLDTAFPDDDVEYPEPTPKERRSNLRRARRLLNLRPISEENFDSALAGIMLCGRQINSWAPRVESAFLALPRKQQHKTRFMLFNFCEAAERHEIVCRHLPKRFDNFLVLGLAMQSLVRLGKLSEAGRLLLRCEYARRNAAFSVTQHYLAGCLAEFYARTGKWEKAIALWEESKFDAQTGAWSMQRIWETRIVQMLKQIESDLHTARIFREKPYKNSQPANENKARWDETIQTLGKTRRKLMKLLPK